MTFTMSRNLEGDNMNEKPITCSIWTKLVCCFIYRFKTEYVSFHLVHVHWLGDEMRDVKLVIFVLVSNQ